MFFATNMSCYSEGRNNDRTRFHCRRENFPWYISDMVLAGTGAGEKKVDFNDSAHSSLHHSTENNLIGMIADISRIRAGDSIIFYLQQKIPRIPEGKFYGVFRATEDFAFLDNNDSYQYLKQQLEEISHFPDLICARESLPRRRNRMGSFGMRSEEFQSLIRCSGA